MKKSKPRRPSDVEIFEDPAIPGPVPAVGLPYTVFFPIDGALRPADLEHASQLPRVGDVVEYIDEHGDCRRFEVTEVIHTLQLSSGRRPRVWEERIPSAFARDEHEPAEAPGDGGLLRAGLPKVILREAAEPSGSTREEIGFRVRQIGQADQRTQVQATPSPKPARSRRPARPAGAARSRPARTKETKRG